MGHGIVTPGAPGWLEEVDRVLEKLKPAQPQGLHDRRPALPDEEEEQLAARRREATSTRCTRRCSRTASRRICIHKGLMPADYRTTLAGPLAVRDRLGRGQGGQATGRRSTSSSTTRRCGRSSSCPIGSLRSSKATGRFDWVSDLADIPRKFGVQQRLRRARHLLRQHLRNAPEACGGAARHAGQADLERIR